MRSAHARRAPEATMALKKAVVPTAMWIKGMMMSRLPSITMPGCECPRHHQRCCRPHAPDVGHDDAKERHLGGHVLHGPGPGGVIAVQLLRSVKVALELLLVRVRDVEQGAHKQPGDDEQGQGLEDAQQLLELGRHGCGWRLKGTQVLMCLAALTDAADRLACAPCACRKRHA